MRLPTLRGLLGLWRELRGLRRDVAELRGALDRLCEVLEARFAAEYPVEAAQHRGITVVGPEGATEVSFVDTEQAAEFMDIETRLTQARGMPPTEEEVLEDWYRRHPELKPTTGGTV